MEEGERKLSTRLRCRWSVTESFVGCDCRFKMRYRQISLSAGSRGNT
jgi:hypothetical protein